MECLLTPRLRAFPVLVAASTGLVCVGAIHELPLRLSVRGVHPARTLRPLGRHRRV